jgi:hypothetical protein
MKIPPERVVLYIKYTSKLSNNKQCVIPDALGHTNSMTYETGKAIEHTAQSYIIHRNLILHISTPGKMALAIHTS